MANKYDKKKDSELKQWCINCNYDDGESIKYVIFRRNYYEAKEEAENIRDEYNQIHIPKITGTFVKEIASK